MYRILIDDIMSRRKDLMYLSVEELAAYGRKLDTRAKSEPLDKLLVDAYALVCEIAKKVVREHPDIRTTQIMAAIALHEGKFVEMQNGEGKTLAATMPVYLNCLKGQHVHIATYNDYLACRDILWMGPIYAVLGLTVGVVMSEAQYQLQQDIHDDTKEEDHDVTYKLVLCSRANAYACDVVYGTHVVFVFDYLRDNQATRAIDIVQGGHLDYIILDEADNVLIDNANQMMQIIEKIPVVQSWYHTLFDIAEQLQKPQDYNIFTTSSTAIELTTLGIARTEEFLWQKGLLRTKVPLYGVEAVGVAEQIIQSLHAIHTYKKDRDYIVVDGRVKVIDFYTGRVQEGDKFQRGIQQAIEVKEGLEVTSREMTMASISYQHFFKHYKKMAGMTATAKEHYKELSVVYGKHVVEILPFTSSQRKDYTDLIYRTQEGRLNAVIDEIEAMHRKGQGRPILVNTMSIEMADEIGRLLKERDINCQVLHAKHAEIEAEIIAQAGKRGTVTVAAKMAGRGTDIQIDEVAERLGGLHVIGVERYETRHMDRQLIGRAGRQGKSGSSRFFLSLDDELMRRFAADRVAGIMKRVGMEDDMPLESKLVSRFIEGAQSQVEGRNFESRRQVYLRDRLRDRQRRSIYEVRRKIVMQEDISEELETLRKNIAARCVQKYIQGRDRSHWKIDELTLYFEAFSSRFRPDNFSSLQELSAKSVQLSLVKMLNAAYNKQRESFRNDVNWIQQERTSLLRHFDIEWSKFLTRLDELQEENVLRSYVEEEKFAWYAIESFKTFQEMMERVEEKFLKEMFGLHLISRKPEIERVVPASQIP
jgi:preprotein translocase subunit SecA